MALLTVDACVGLSSPGRLLRRINRLMLARIEQRFSGADFGFTSWLALKLMHDGIVANAGDLAREIGMTTGATTRLIDGLEALGLVVRVRCGFDRRVVRLRLTDAGGIRYGEHLPVVVACWNEVFADFEQPELGQFISLLGRLLKSFERTEVGIAADPAVPVAPELAGE